MPSPTSTTTLVVGMLGGARTRGETHDGYVKPLLRQLRVLGSAQTSLDHLARGRNRPIAPFFNALAQEPAQPFQPRKHLRAGRGGQAARRDPGDQHLLDPDRRGGPATSRPAQVVGLHFFNPATVQNLVEVIPSVLTGQDTADRARAFVADALGRTAAPAADRSGFVFNALIVPYLLSAIRMLEAGHATAEDIDTGMTLGCAHPMGPLKLADLIGLDTVKAIADSMYAEYKDRAGHPRSHPESRSRRRRWASPRARLTTPSGTCGKGASSVRRSRTSRGSSSCWPTWR
jgi:hypothetical protein